MDGSDQADGHEVSLEVSDGAPSIDDDSNDDPFIYFEEFIVLF